MHRSAITRLLRTSFLLALLAASTSACGADRDDVPEGTISEIGQGVRGWRPATWSEYAAMPDSVRLDTARNAWWISSERGVAVEVDLRIAGLRGKSIPLAYSLHDARNDIPFVSHTIPITPDAPRWTRQAYVWLPVPSPGTYYVRIALNDSTGRKNDGPRTQDFTIQ